MAELVDCSCGGLALTWQAGSECPGCRAMRLQAEHRRRRWHMRPATKLIGVLLWLEQLRIDWRRMRQGW